MMEKYEAARLLKAIVGLKVSADETYSSPLPRFEDDDDSIPCPNETESKLLNVYLCRKILDEATCLKFKQLAIEHTDEFGWCTKRHASFMATDFSIRDAPKLWEYIKPIIQHRVLGTVRSLFFPEAGEDLVMGVEDLFCIKYDCAPGGQRNLKPHRDCSLISFSILINSPSEFTGGGTEFTAMEKTVAGGKGDLVLHSGQLRHAGYPIESGERWILVGFVKCNNTGISQKFLERVQRDP